MASTYPSSTLYPGAVNAYPSYTVAPDHIFTYAQIDTWTYER
jgi:hypothetical protein